MTQRVRGRPFRKGASGNSAGRLRSGESIAEYIRELGGSDGRLYVDRLHALATGTHTNTRAMLAAIGVLLERGFGRPPQAIEHSGVIENTKVNTDACEDHELELAILLSRKLRGEEVPELSAIRDLLQQAIRLIPKSAAPRPSTYDSRVGLHRPADPPGRHALKGVPYT